jgi:hypothetical protein
MDRTKQINRSLLPKTEHGSEENSPEIEVNNRECAICQLALPLDDLESDLGFRTNSVYSSHMQMFILQ